MLGVAIYEETLPDDHACATQLLARLRDLRIPHVVIERAETELRDIVEALGVPAGRIYVIARDPARLYAAQALGMQTIAATSLDEALEQLCEPYTRSALNLRYLFRTVLAWRPGHFKS